MDIAGIIASPSTHYPSPVDLVADPRLSARDKRRVLASWRDEARLLQQAEDEGLQGADTAALQDLLHAAREALDAEPVVLEPGTRKVAGIYGSGADARQARAALEERLSADAAIDLVAPGQDVIIATAGHGEPTPSGGNGVSDDAVRGGAAGAGAMAAGLGALAATGVLITAPLALGLAGVGGLLGSAAAAAGSLSLRDPDFVALLREAAGHGHWILLAQVSSESEALAVQDALAGTRAAETIDHGGVRQAVGH